MGNAIEIRGWGEGACRKRSLGWVGLSLFPSVMFNSLVFTLILIRAFQRNRINREYRYRLRYRDSFEELAPGAEESHSPILEAGDPGRSEV